MDRQIVWFVNSVHIKSNKNRRLEFPSLLYRVTNALRKWFKIRHKSLTSCWHDYNWEKFPIDTRTWGFFLVKDYAIQSVLGNYTDIHENYYQYVVVEGIEEGVMSFPKKENQLYFYWNHTSKKWLEMVSPSAITDIYAKYEFDISFTDF